MSQLSQPYLSNLSHLLPPSKITSSSQSSSNSSSCNPNTHFERNGHVGIPNLAVPGVKLQIAKQAGVHKNLLLCCYAGIGDQVVSEPTLRYAIDNFKGYEISLATHHPSLFSHLPFKKVYHLLKESEPPWEQYLCYNLAGIDKDLSWDFICGLFTPAVDFASLCAFRMTLPLAYKNIILVPLRYVEIKIKELIKKELSGKKWIIVHPGAHWQSKTFPQIWWNLIIKHIKKSGILPVLIGDTTTDHCGTRSTVSVNTDGCLDLRGKLELMDTVCLMQHSKVVLTNDSAPLHMAAASECWIGFVSVSKHPEYLLHYRHGQLGWRMKSFETGGIWEHYHPLSEKSVIDIGEFRDNWLPDPEEFARWAIDNIEHGEK